MKTRKRKAIEDGVWTQQESAIGTMDIGSYDDSPFQLFTTRTMMMRALQACLPVESFPMPVLDVVLDYAKNSCALVAWQLPNKDIRTKKPGHVNCPLLIEWYVSCLFTPTTPRLISWSLPGYSTSTKLLCFWLGQARKRIAVATTHGKVAYYSFEQAGKTPEVKAVVSLPTPAFRARTQFVRRPGQYLWIRPLTRHFLVACTRDTLLVWSCATQTIVYQHKASKGYMFGDGVSRNLLIRRPPSRSHGYSCHILERCDQTGPYTITSQQCRVFAFTLLTGTTCPTVAVTHLAVWDTVSADAIHSFCTAQNECIVTVLADASPTLFQPWTITRRCLKTAQIRDSIRFYANGSGKSIECLPALDRILFLWGECDMKLCTSECLDTHGRYRYCPFRKLVTSTYDYREQSYGTQTALCIPSAGCRPYSRPLSDANWLLLGRLDLPNLGVHLCDTNTSTLLPIHSFDELPFRSSGAICMSAAFLTVYA